MALTKKLDAIGAAIREKTGDTNKYTLDEMVTAIGTISGGGGGSAAGLIDGTTTVLKDGDAKAVNMAFINSNLTEINLPKAESVDFVNNNTSWGIKCQVDGSTYNCGAFGANSKLAKVSMPKCKKVGDCTFIGCTALTSDNIDLSACTSIGQYAFYYCIGLKTVDWLGACLTVGNYAFSACKNLTAVSLPACTSLGTSTFYGCTSLASVELPACETMQADVFSNCTKLKSVNLPNCTTLNSYRQFYNCTSLESISLPVCTFMTGNSTFGYCENLTDVDLPMLTTITSDSTFTGCKKLKKIKFPQGSEIYLYQIFNNCWLLESVDFPMLAKNISQYAFNNCYSLTAVIIRTTYKVLALDSTNAFSNCYHFYGTVNATYNPDGLKDGYIYVPDTLVDSYKTATNWATLADQIKPLSELPTA